MVRQNLKKAPPSSSTPIRTVTKAEAAKKIRNGLNGVEEDRTVEETTKKIRAKAANKKDSKKETVPKTLTQNVKQNGAAPTNSKSDVPDNVGANITKRPRKKTQNAIEEKVVNNTNSKEKTSDKTKRKNDTVTKNPKSARPKAVVTDKNTKTSGATDEPEASGSNVKITGKAAKRKPVSGSNVTASTKSAKRQKFLLEVPTVPSVSGKVFVFGDNMTGQLGLGDEIEEKKRPALLEFPQSVVDIAAGGMHSVCLTESGEVFTFGCNDEGALGRATEDEGSEHVPKKVEIPEKIVQVSAGDSHSAALSDSGHVYIWGNFRKGDGVMGLVTDGHKETTPVRILNNVTVVKIASGENHFVCLSNEGVVYTCGCAEVGQLGRVSAVYASNGSRRGMSSLLTPDKVPIGKSGSIQDIWATVYGTFVRMRDSNDIYAFGLNNFSQLGCEPVTDFHGNSLPVLKPRKIESFSQNSWSQISGGQHHTLALDDSGLVYALGRPEYGRLGLGNGDSIVSAPTKIPTLQNEKCISISCGNTTSFAVSNNGSAFSWGMGNNFALGHGKDTDEVIPRQIEGNFSKSWKALKVAGGGQHTLILATPRETQAV